MSGPVRLALIAAEMERAASDLADNALVVVRGAEDEAAAAVLNEVWKEFAAGVRNLATEHGMDIGDADALLTISFRAYGNRIERGIHRIGGAR